MDVDLRLKAISTNIHFHFTRSSLIVHSAVRSIGCSWEQSGPCMACILHQHRRVAVPSRVSLRVESPHQEASRFSKRAENTNSRNWRVSATRCSRLCRFYAPRGSDSSSLLPQHALQPIVTLLSSFAPSRSCDIRDIARGNTAQQFLSSQSTGLSPLSNESPISLLLRPSSCVRR
jgi:hypothetical protein